MEIFWSLHSSPHFSLFKLTKRILWAECVVLWKESQISVKLTRFLDSNVIKNNECLPLLRFDVNKKYRVTSANKWVQIKLQLSRSSHAEITSCWAEDAEHSRRLPSFQTVNVFPLLLPTFLSRALVADLPPDLLQNPLLKLVTEMKQV